MKRNSVGNTETQLFLFHIFKIVEINLIRRFSHGSVINRTFIYKQEFSYFLVNC